FVGLYLLSIFTAAVVAWVFGRTFIKGEAEPLLLELPDYRRPSWRNIGLVTWERSTDFVKNAGTIIMAISIVLWFAATHPNVPVANAATPDDGTTETVYSEPELANSYAGRLGHFIEPVIKPLGYDWKLGVSLVTSFAAREVFVGTMSTLYGLQEEDGESRRLEERLTTDTYADGTPRYSFLTALSLLFFYAFAAQCMSTFAVVARETRSWKWATFMVVYMTALAYVSALLVYQGGKLVGLA
ncbi:MAG: ferrous iron transporter B, partial [Myxococcales bacterium]|nr:ferrous iron transporter B [Myxococcales bacterium]